MQQQKYDAMFAAVPRYDDKNKEECAVWINWISSLAASARCNLRLELINRSEGDVTMIIAGMDDNVSDEDLKEEIMRCFFQCSDYDTSYWSVERYSTKTE